jgi:hypothetical protein
MSHAQCGVEDHRLLRHGWPLAHETREE